MTPSKLRSLHRADCRKFISSTDLKSHPHSLPDFPRDLAADLRDDRCGLTQLRGLQSRIADLSGSINLAYINDLVGVEFFPIVLLSSASCFGSSAPITANGLTRASSRREPKNKVMTRAQRASLVCKVLSLLDYSWFWRRPSQL